MTRNIDEMSYEEAVRALREKIAQGDPDRPRKYTPVIQLDRGLGDEFRNLCPVEGRTLAEAKALAWSAATRYVSETPGYEKAVVKHVNLRLTEKRADVLPESV